MPDTSAKPNAANYAVRGEIARGGMGSILEAEDRKLQRTVAMKVMLLELDADADQRQRFINEAAVLAKLAHPNIVPIHDIGHDARGQMFYTMKLVHGRTLQSILAALREQDTDAMRDYTLNSLLTIFRKVCDALAFAHSRGIIHRDLKPENIMVGEFGEVLVMDWGLAKRMSNDECRMTMSEGAAPARSVPTDSAAETIASSSSDTLRRDALRKLAHGTEFGVTLEGDVMGTPQYMSPEQAEGRIADMDARSDIFSLGGILYTILTLRPPVEGTMLDEVLRNVISGSITVPTSFGVSMANGATGPNGEVLEARKIKPLPHCPGGRVPTALSAVVMKALSVKREARYQNVAAFSADVEAYQNGFATSAEEASAWKLFTLFLKRNKAASIGVAAVLIIGTPLGTKAFIEGQRAERALADLKKSAPALLKLGESEADTQHFADALRDIDAALTLDASLARARWQRAWVLLGLERWAEAADALRLAQQHDPSGAQFASILPAVEKLAAASEVERWKSDAAREVFTHLQSAGATGPVLALAGKLKIGAEARRKLVDQRLVATLGKGIYSVSVTTDGSVEVFLNQQNLVRSCEPFRGLPCDILTLNGVPVEDAEPLRGMALRKLTLAKSLVSDLSPLAGMPLTFLSVGESYKLSDLRPLAGMPLTELEIHATNLSDLSPLAGMRLTKLVMWGSKVFRIDALRGMPLVRFDASRTKISDLSPLKGAPLETVFLDYCGYIIDLSPLRDAPVKELRLRSIGKIADFTPILTLPHLEWLSCDVLPKELLPLRESKTLQTIDADAFPGEKIQGPRPVAEFWQAYDAHQAEQK